MITRACSNVSKNYCRRLEGDKTQTRVLTSSIWTVMLDTHHQTTVSIFTVSTTDLCVVANKADANDSMLSESDIFAKCNRHHVRRCRF